MFFENLSRHNNWPSQLTLNQLKPGNIFITYLNQICFHCPCATNTGVRKDKFACLFEITLSLFFVVCQKGSKVVLVCVRKFPPPQLCTLCHFIQPMSTDMYTPIDQWESVFCGGCGRHTWRGVLVFTNLSLLVDQFVFWLCLLEGLWLCVSCVPWHDIFKRLE